VRGGEGCFGDNGTDEIVADIDEPSRARSVDLGQLLVDAEGVHGPPLTPANLAKQLGIERLV
jgi:hypothetical protein